MPVLYTSRSTPLSANSAGYGTSMRVGYDFTGHDTRPLHQAYDFEGATNPTLVVSGGAHELVTLNGIPGVQPVVSGAIGNYSSATNYGLQVGTGDYTICVLFSTPAALPASSGSGVIFRLDNGGSGNLMEFSVSWSTAGWQIGATGPLGGAFSLASIGANRTVAFFVRRLAGSTSAWRYVLGVDSAVGRRYGDFANSTDWNATNAQRCRTWAGAISGSKTDWPVLHAARFHNVALSNEDMAAYAADWWAVDAYAADEAGPTWEGPIAVGAKTSSSIALTLPTASDTGAGATGVAGYEYRVDGGAWVDNGSSTAVALSDLAALTSYTIDARAYDAAENVSSTLSVTASTYRAGASAGSIRTATGPQDGNPAGMLYDFCELLPTSDWVSYSIVSGPTPSGGTLDAQPNGAFSYTGPAPATLVIQPEVNGAASGDPITVTLYDQTGELSGGSDAITYVDAGGVLDLSQIVLSAGADFLRPADAGGNVATESGALVAGADALVYADAAAAIRALSKTRAPAIRTAAYLNTARFQKAPGELLDFDLDFSEELAETADSADDIRPVELQIPAGIALVGAFWVYDIKRIKVWLSGGQDGRKYTCTAWLNTAGGRRLELDFLVRVKD